MLFDARSEMWMPMQIRGVDGYFSDVRIDRDSVPKEFQLWEFADGDCDGIPCRYKPKILVNFFGTFFTTGDLPVDDEERQAGYIGEDEWIFCGECYQTLSFIDCLEIATKEE